MVGSMGSKANTLNEPLVYAQEWMMAGKEVAIATVISTWGSAPRPVGSHMAICEDGRFEGSVSGGCVEAAVITEAMDLMKTGEPKIVEFGVSDETAFQVGLSCGGNIKVYLERVG